MERLKNNDGHENAKEIDCQALIAKTSV